MGRNSHAYSLEVICLVLWSLRVQIAGHVFLLVVLVFASLLRISWRLFWNEVTLCWAEAMLGLRHHYLSHFLCESFLNNIWKWYEFQSWKALKFPPLVAYALGFASGTVIAILICVLQSLLPVQSVQGSASSGRARRDAAARAMQGWHSQRLLSNGEFSDPIIKVWLNCESD